MREPVEFGIEGATTRCNCGGQLIHFDIFRAKTPNRSLPSLFTFIAFRIVNRSSVQGFKCRKTALVSELGSLSTLSGHFPNLVGTAPRGGSRSHSLNKPETSGWRNQRPRSGK